MSVACPTCGQIALPPARYCRACYTVFPTPRFAVARREPGSESRVWQLAILLAVAVGGWWAYNSDGAAPLAEENWTTVAAPAEDEDEDDGFASTARSERAENDGNASRRRPAHAARTRAAPSSGAWLLHLAPTRVCGGAAGCEVTIGFASGERARFAVRPQSASTSTLVPIAGDGGALLDRYGRARVIPQGDEDRAISIVSPGGRRWIALGGG